MLIKTRRDFMKAALGSVAALGAMGKLSEMSAFASSGGPYQALVCIFLAGGNDSHNMVIPIQAPSNQNTWALYQKGRQNLAISQAALLPINNGNDAYGLHPNMPELQALYNNGNAAILANVGMLVKPTTRADFQSNNPALVPSQLFSHSDQTNQWQSAIPNGTSPTGWGGRVEDALMNLNSGANFTPITSTTGCGLFCNGQSTYAATVPVGGASLLLGANSGARLGAVQQLMLFDNGLKLVQAANTIETRGVGFSQALNVALASSKINTVFPATSIGGQLQTVARLMNIRTSLNVSRQLFFCQLGGFDTHGAELSQHDVLMQQLSQALGAFYTATQEVGTDKNSITFTASEFGRTLQPNGNLGTDHAWGSHHIVMGSNYAGGGSLKGGQFYGTFPSLVLNGQDDANTRGTLVPTTSVDQYAATMAQWFGVDPTQIDTIFPYVQNFGVGNSNLGFLG
jgi:uncharacterized protein (DUF1501 family)